MAIRHRVPTIFSIYMVDVLCCALGCVILLWQVNFQEAEKQTLAAEARNDDLQASLDRLKNARLSIHSLASEVDHLKIALDSSKKREVQVTLLLDDTRKSLEAAEQLALVRKKDFDALKATHIAAEAVLEKLRGDFKQLESKSNLTGEELAEKIKANSALLLRVAEAEKRLRNLEIDLGEKSTALLSADKKVVDQNLKLSDLERLANSLGKDKIDLLAKLQTADLRVRLLEGDLAKLLGESNDTKKSMAELLRDREALTVKANLTSKDVELLRAAVESLNAEKIQALRQAKAIQAAAENRFAGITLTGRKVVFMVDMSGSMELTELNTADPDKWPEVCETIGRILRSLVDATHYQVILFSDKVRYPMGGDGRWFEIRDREVEAKNVVAALRATKPQGPTNMYAAFEETFKFRPQGLDTIYVISDGLPNDGPGLPAGATNLTEQVITSTLSKHLRSKLTNDWNRMLPLSPRVRINTVGFFYESPEVGAFLWVLAREHQGSFVGLR